MAYERKKSNEVKGDSLDAFITGTMDLYKNQLSIRNAEDETRFAELVLDKNLSLDSQLDYRKEQLKRTTDDPTERKRVRLEIAGLKDRVEQKKFTDTYTQQVIDHEAGLTSVDAFLSWLNDQKATSTNQTVLDSVNVELAKRTAEKFALTKSLIEKQTTYALNDKTIPVLDAQIDRVTSERNNALLNGRNELAATYDLHIQALNQAKSQALIQKDVLNAAVSTIAGQSSAVNLLDFYNNKIAGSSSSGSVTFSGTTFNSERDFWTYKRDSYLADASGSGFFDRFKTEKDSEIKVANSQKSLSTDTLDKIARSYNEVATRAELAPYVQRLTTVRQENLQTGADYISEKILNTFSMDDDLPTANAKLDSLSKLGVNTDKAYSEMIISNSTRKSGQVNDILQQAQSLMASNVGMTPAQAVSQAVAQGYGTSYSPKELAGETAASIATKGLTGSQRETLKESVNTTLGQTPSAPAPTVALTKQLDLGLRDPQVKELQKFLNQAGFAVAAAGQPGSAGMETDYFGPATQAALKKFQTAQGVVSSGDPATTGFGRLGPQTLTAIQSWKPPEPKVEIQPTVQPQIQPPTQPAGQTPSQPSTTQPAVNVSAPYTFKETGSGTVEVYKNGQRIATAAKSYATSAYGYTG